MHSMRVPRGASLQFLRSRKSESVPEGVSFVISLCSRKRGAQGGTVGGTYICIYHASDARELVHAAGAWVFAKSITSGRKSEMRCAVTP